MKKLLAFILSALVLTACNLKAKQKKQNLEYSSAEISKVIDKMMDVMINDVTNPPLASRFFAYTTLAGYEVISQNDKDYKSMYGVLNSYPNLSRPDSIKGFSKEFSAIIAMMETAKKMQPSGRVIDSFEVHYIDSCRNQGLDEEVINNSLRYAKAVSKAILAYAKADRYNRMSNYPRYTPQQTEGSWYPTPPGYFAPVEPYFNTVRPFTLDTCNQFMPAPPVAFSRDKNSPFYKLLHRNYAVNTNLTNEQRDIALFWDCNPFALQDNGHLLAGRKKISPGAHWLGITGIACQQAKTGFDKAMKIHAMVSVALMDGFIACWDEKFRSNRIRPETAIRKYIDPEFEPLLQTPPFPEYLSGHSTISAASAVVLTHYFGDNFGYTDTIEVRFGLPARQFKSFDEAAVEAGISRFYGGIHFIDAIDNGRKQGLQVGEWVINTVEKNAKTLAKAH